MVGAADTREAWEAFFRERCAAAVRSLVASYPDQRSVPVDVVELHRHDPDLVERLFREPGASLDTARGVLRGLDPAIDRVNVRLENYPGLIGLGAIKSRHVGELVSVEAVIEDLEPPEVALETATYECGICGQLSRIRPAGGVLFGPDLCPDCSERGTFRLVPGASTYVDLQRARLVEPPNDSQDERRRLEARLEDDLVGTVAVGEPRVITGIVRPEGHDGENRFALYLEVVSVREELHGRPLADDEREIHDVIRERWERLAGY